MKYIWEILEFPFLLLFLFTTLLLLFAVKRLRGHHGNKELPCDSRNSACGSCLSVGFFHPYCNAGGGGERVLWCAIRSLQKRYDFVQCVVYTGDTDATEKEILQRAKERFNIELKRDVKFVYLYQRKWITAERYPIFTILGQSLGSIILGMEALLKFSPDILIDSMGYAFILPLFKYIGGSKTCSYVHYPTISTDMIEKVASRREDFNNTSSISKSLVLSYIKLLYYKLFALFYQFVGGCSDVVMVNSTWTQNHINRLWRIPHRTTIVYPPCDTKNLLQLAKDMDETAKTTKKLISIGQFRPEKNHVLQLEAFKLFLNTQPKLSKSKFQLYLIGSCRGTADEVRVDALKIATKKLGIQKYVHICVNIPYDELIGHLMEATVGIHTMPDEHFGIGVVEFMAAGVIPVAHDSAGPKLDIVIDWEGQPTGFLAKTATEYSVAMLKIFNMSPNDKWNMVLNGRESVRKRFSEETFNRRFLSETEFLFT